MSTACVGGGVHGLLSAYTLMRAGKQVVVYECRPAGHELGSSHGSRNINVWWDQQDRAPLQARGLAGWRKLAQELGGFGLTPRNCIQLLRPDALEAVRAANALAHQPVEVISADQLRRTYGIEAFVDPALLLVGGSNVLNMALALAALRRALEAGGAQFDAREVDTVQNGYLTFGSGEPEQHEAIVLCAGPWIGSLLRRSGITLPLVVTSQQYSVFATANALSCFAPIMLRDVYGWGGETFYSVPNDEGSVKIAADRRGPEVPPGTGSVDLELEALTCRYADDRFGRRLWFRGSQVCWYTSTPDRLPIIGRLPGMRDVIIAHACAGGGAKLAAGVAELVLSLISGTEPPVSIEQFRPERFLG